MARAPRHHPQAQGSSAASARPTPAWRSVLPAYLVSRVVVFATAYVAQRVWPERIRVPWRAFPDVLLLDGMLRWDSGWYWNIIERGYQYVPGRQSNIAFFPLFPLLSWLGGVPLEQLGMSPRRAFFAAALVLANTAFFLALIGLYRLAQRTLGDVPAARAVWLVALYPFSFFFSAAYTEALALALAVWAFYLASRNRWVLAALLAALCTATRTPGIFLAPALGLELLRQRGFKLRALFPDALALLIVPLGLAAFCVYQWFRFGDPLAFAYAQGARGWNRELSGLHLYWGFVHMLRSTQTAEIIIHAVTLVIVGATMGLAAWSVRRLGAGLGFFGVASVIVPVLSGFTSLGRYMGIDFPAFMMGGLALARRRWIFVAVCVVFAAFLVLFSGLFSLGKAPY